LQAFSASIGVSEKYLFKLAADLAGKIVLAMQQSIQELHGAMGPSEQTMAERLAHEIARICKKRTAKFLDLGVGLKS